MNTMIKNESIAVASNPVTSEMIGKKLGLAAQTVRKYMSKNANGRSNPTVDLVRKTAKEMGYDPKKAISESVRNAQKARWSMTAEEWEAQKMAQKAKKEADYLLTHNFPSTEAETRRMLHLQSKGYSNAEIGKAVGRSYQTVLRRIGKQAPDVTKANHAYAMKLRADKNAHRRLTAANHTVNVYNEIVTELEELKNRTNVLETKIEEIKPKLKDALKIATVEPMTISSDNNLANAEPTVIQ